MQVLYPTQLLAPLLAPNLLQPLLIMVLIFSEPHKLYYTIRSYYQLLVIPWGVQLVSWTRHYLSVDPLSPWV